MNIDTWFPTSILSSKLDLEYDALTTRAYEIQKQAPGGATWLCNTYNSLNAYDLKSDELFAPVINRLAEHAYNFAQYFCVNKPLVCEDAWINIAPPGAYQEYHIHPGMHFSLVAYIKTQSGCGDIVFQNPMANLDMFPLPTDAYAPSNFSTCSYTAENGKVLCFRANLPHMVQINNSTEDRISLALNFLAK